MPTGPTSRRARVSEPTRVTRPTNPRLLANPSHRHKRLLIYRRCRYFLIFPLLTYCCPRYIFFAQDGRRKGGVPEVEVVQNRQFISIHMLPLHSCSSQLTLRPPGHSYDVPRVVYELTKHSFILWSLYKQKAVIL